MANDIAHESDMEIEIVGEILVWKNSLAARPGNSLPSREILDITLTCTNSSMS